MILSRIAKNSLNIKHISLFIQKILNKLALGLADTLIRLKRPAVWLGQALLYIVFRIGRYTVWPLLLFTYKTLSLARIRLKNFNWLQIRYLVFFKKYLPALVIVVIITVATSHNILAQNYNVEEYVNRTLLPSLIANNSADWSEIIEEGAVNQPPAGSSSYLSEESNLQELVVATPFAEDSESGYGDITPDGSGLTLGPEDAGREDFTGRSEAIEYLVQAGDVLGAIAEKFNISVNTVLWANGLNWNSTIRPGQKLVILPRSGLNHEVKSGDTVSSIAKKYQVEMPKIIEANKLADASDINIGDLLFVPDGVKPVQVVSSYKPKTAPAQPAVNIADLPAALESGTKLLWPVISKRITQYYSWRHSGVDIGDKTGSPIYAAESGKVVRAGWSRGYGYNLVINHGDGFETLYGHASKLLVATGDTVERGQTIALVGSTGWSTGPHLHIEVRVNDVRQNPLNYIK